MKKSDPIDRRNLPPKYWEKKSLSKMTPREWDALCDGCGKCCLNKIEDEVTSEVLLTRVCCRLLDENSCRCSNFELRHKFVPECIVLTSENIEKHSYWLPETCAYLLLWQNKPLFDWHPLLSGDSSSVETAGISVKNKTLTEINIHEDEWENYPFEDC